MDYILEVKDLYKKYNGFTLEKASFHLPYGKIMGLVGENGAGKTTIIKLILNAIGRDQGEIKVFGRDNVLYESKIKENLGVVLDQCYFDDCLDVNSISSIMKSIYHNWDNKVYLRYVEELCIPKKKRIKSYSRGMKAKLSIAIALSTNPSLLILDEPTAGLDPVVRDEILQIYSDYVSTRNSSILFSSHITSDIEKIADIVTFINHGKIILSIDQEQLYQRFAEVTFSRERFEVDNDKMGIISCLKENEKVKALVDREVYKQQIDKSSKVNIERMLIYFVNGTVVG